MGTADDLVGAEMVMGVADKHIQSGGLCWNCRGGWDMNGQFYLPRFANLSSQIRKSYLTLKTCFEKVIIVKNASKLQNSVRVRILIF